MLTIIKNRRSVRSYTDRRPERFVLEQVVEAAGWAPSGMDRQSWQFLVIQGEALEYLRTAVREQFCALELKDSHPPFFAKCKQWAEEDEGWSFFYGAPALLVISNVAEERNAMAESAAAAENAILEAAALGLSSCWITTLNGLCDEPGLRPVLTGLGIPTNHRIYVALALGYGADQPKPSPRTYRTRWVEQAPALP